MRATKAPHRSPHPAAKAGYHQRPEQTRQRGADQLSDTVLPRARRASAAAILSFVLAFCAIAGQLITIGLTQRNTATLASAEPVATTFSRPDIVDRNGRLLATDLQVPSLFADPALVIDRDEVAEKLQSVMPDIDRREIRRLLHDRSRRFAWIRRGVSPAVAQRVHNLGLPGLSFRYELKRAYPAGRLAGHVLGSVNVDNKGLDGIERYIDDSVGVIAVNSAELSQQPPVRLSLDVGVQHALESELSDAMSRHKTAAAAGLVMDVTTGEVLASASIPNVDPAFPAAAATSAGQLDRISGGTFELGSVFKTITVGMALDEGLATPSSLYDVTKPLQAGRHSIEDHHHDGRPLTVTEIFTHSSNVGAGMMALQAGAPMVQRFMGKLGLLDPLSSEAGSVARPQLPKTWDRAALITTSYGHGIAVAPLQFAAAVGALLNDGQWRQPTYLKSTTPKTPVRNRLVTGETSAELARMFRLNVMTEDGTGRGADAKGYRVGGKTGTADIAAGGGYRSKSVLASFLAAFPMDNPRYLTFVLLFEPKASAETRGQRTAAYNAAPLSGRLISRIAPQLGVAPLNIVATQ